MATERRSEAAEAQLTPGLRGWLRHLRAADRSAGTLKAYAARRGLPVQSLYQARKRLRRLGVLAPSGRRGKKKPPAAFVKVERAVVPLPANHPTWRIRLPGGVVFESRTALAHEDLLALVQALAALR
jgi:hypothetical protein